MAKKRTKTPKCQPFDVSKSRDPEAAEVVAALLDIAVNGSQSLRELDEFRAVEPGEQLMRTNASWNRRGVVALVEQARYWLRMYRALTEQTDIEKERLPWYDVPDGEQPFYRLGAIAYALALLSRRRILLTDDDLVGLIEVATNAISVRRERLYASAAITLAEYFAQDRAPDDRVCDALMQLRVVLESESHISVSKLRSRIDRLLAGSDSELDNAGSPLPPGAIPAPATVGRPDVLVDLKQRLGILPKDRPDQVETELIGPDYFALRSDSLLRQEHTLLSKYYESCLTPLGALAYYEGQLTKTSEGAEILNMTPRERGQIFLAACERARGEYWEPDNSEEVGRDRWDALHAATVLTRELTDTALDLSRQEAFDGLLRTTTDPNSGFTPASGFEMIEALVGDSDLSQGERHVIHRLRCVTIDVPPMGACPPVAERVCELLGEPSGYWLVPGEHWADQVHADVAGMNEKERATWFALFGHASTANASKPSATWSKSATKLVDEVGQSRFSDLCGTWFPKVAKGRSIKVLSSYVDCTQGAADVFNEGNATILRGLVWMLARHASEKSPRHVADLLLTSIKKVPGVGPRAVKVANACVWALGEMAASEDEAIQTNALGQLARLKARVTFKTTLKAIEKALDKAAEAAGMSRTDLEELGVPAFGFERGRLRQELGGASVELRVEGNKVVTHWTNDKGKTVKSPPAAVKRDFKDEVKELKQFAKDAEGILRAGRERLDTMYLADSSWTLTDWRERYLDHGLIGTLAERLIWLVDDTPVLFMNSEPTDVTGKPVEFASTAEVKLWHPVGRAVEEVTAWRRRIEESKVTQPFKQAHREVYLLTDAERHTGVYSNRYAAHILRQHQFNALCGARGWRNKLRLMVDDEYEPAMRELPRWNLRAEFWVEGAGDEYGEDTNDSGVYLYLATDQVRFYPIDSRANTAHAGGGPYAVNTHYGEGTIQDPVPVADIPPLVFSEIMRDVDLFVGVASVGNDPAWQDGGREGRYRDYWTGYAFGDLSATAQTRKAVLEGLVPRLKIADRCRIEEKFLVVRGDVRTYKIHLGSGNILMEPNDQYLCIVPARGTPGRGAKAKGPGQVFLPFEGDNTLSVILSKAFMLAEDKKITDPTILSQIGEG